MYRKRINLFFLLLLLLGLNILCGNGFAAIKIKLATGEWDPLTGAKIKNYGLFSEIVTASFENQGEYIAEFSFFPWARCEENVRKGEFFAAFPYTPTAERGKEFIFSDPVLATKTFLYYNAGREGIKEKIGDENSWGDPELPMMADGKIDMIEKLKKFSLGGIIGYFYEEAFKSAGLKVDFSTTENMAFKKLLVGRIELQPQEQLIVQKLIDNDVSLQKTKFSYIRRPFSATNLSLMVQRFTPGHKNYPESDKILKAFNQGLAQIKKNGIYQSILKKHGLLP
ncbi:MAG: transporter substrate-binding domain-containing protein [Oligoflexia bacterium]|nr:transporter substrate-binding domain-containing protein [Oligoflexia bacterium]